MCVVTKYTYLYLYTQHCKCHNTQAVFARVFKRSENPQAAYRPGTKLHKSISDKKQNQRKHLEREGPLNKNNKKKDLKVKWTSYQPFSPPKLDKSFSFCLFVFKHKQLCHRRKAFSADGQINCSIQYMLIPLAAVQLTAAS